MAGSSGTDMSGSLTVISGIVLLLAGIFARSIPIISDQGSLTRPGLIISGLVCLLIAAYPALKGSFFKTAKKPAKRGGGY